MVVAATATTATLTGHGAIHTSTLLRESTTTRFCIGWASLPFACKNHEKSGALMCSSSKIRASSTTPIKAVAKEAQLASTEIDQKRRTKYHYLVANAKFMLDEEEHFNELMCERLRNYGERNKEVDFWLVIEPKFLDKFPDVTKRLRRPAVALVSTNGTWITSNSYQSSPDDVEGIEKTSSALKVLRKVRSYADVDKAKKSHASALKVLGKVGAYANVEKTKKSHEICFT